MKCVCFVIGVLVFSVPALSQKKGVVKALLTDSTAAPLQGVTAAVVTEKDSTLLMYSISAANGFVEFRGLDTGRYLLVASATGFTTRFVPFSMTSRKAVVDLGKLSLKDYHHTMETVVVTDRTPVRIKGDTVSFNASSFRTKPDATVEDLIRKLPGLRVDKNGTVQAQGEQVHKVYVDGKEFFSNDPRLATQNLTADMIEQVEVFDDMSEQAKFSRIDDGSRTKAINLRLKKDRKKGVFGKLYGGYGTEERYDGGGSMNIFRGASQTSIIAKANNTNNAGFSFSEMIGVFGTGVRAFGEQASISGTGIQMPSSGSFYMPMLNTGNQGNGITRSMQGGLNYRDTWSRHFDVNGSYFFTDQDNSQQSVRLRQAFSTDTAWRTAHRSAATSENRAHRVNMNMILLLDSSFSIIYNPSLSILSSGMRSADSLDFSRHVADTAEAFNETIAALHSTGAGTTITNNLVLRKRSRKRGRTLSVIATHMASDQERKYVTTTKSTLNPQDVSGESITESRNRLAGFSYTEPLGRVMIMEVNYSYGQSANVSRREIASFNRNTGRYDLRHDSLSGNFERQQEYHRGGINFRAAGKKHTIQAGVALQDITTEDRHLQTGSGAFMHNRDLFPSAIYQYQFRRTKSFKLVYRGSTRQPSITQLMEPVDMSSPPYYYTGNRSLVQEFSNTATISYNAFDPSSFRSLFLQVTASNTVDKISNDVTMHADGTQTLRPVNLPGFYAVGSNMNLGIPLNRLNTASFNFNTRLNILREPGVFNGQRTFTDCFMAGQELRLNLGGEGADVSLGGGITYTSVLYDHQQLKTPQSLLNGSYVTYTASGEADLALPAGFRLATDVDYTANRGRAEEYNVDYLMCNGSLIKVFGKKKGTELRLTAFDLLSQNVNVVRITGTNFIEDTRTNTLGRFYMLIFTMKLQKMGGK